MKPKGSQRVPKMKTKGSKGTKMEPKNTEIRRPLRCRRVRFMLATPNTTNTHKSLFYEILQQPDTTITTDTTGSLILPLPPILPVVI